MSEAHYGIVDVFWTATKTTIQIVSIPEADLKEKLAVLSTEGGITKEEYYNFVVTKCLLDVDRIGRLVGSLSTTIGEEKALVEDLVGRIVEINPCLDPAGLVLTKNGVIAPGTPGEGGALALSDNPRWNEGLLDDTDGAISDDLDNLLMEMGGSPSMTDVLGVPTDDDDVPSVSVDWEDVSLTFKVRQFKESDLDELFKTYKSFAGPNNFKIFVLMKCIVHCTQLMMTIENLGIAADIPPTEVADILYKFCCGVNPFLDQESLVNSGRIKIGINKPTRDVNDRKPRQPIPSNGKAATTTTPPTTAKKPKRTFSAVPKKAILSLSEKMRSLVIGQNDAVDSVAEAVQVAAAGLRDPHKPIGVFLFTGDSGCGKTHCAKMLAKELCGDETAMVRIDCSEYAYGHEISKLIGSANGYIGFELGGQLTNKIIENPFSVILLDELEKAHSKFYDILLQILDEAHLTDNKGNVVDFSDTIIIMTSNIGSKEVKHIGKTVGFGDVAKVSQSKREIAINDAVKRHFRPEFLNRLDNIITFNSLGEEECKRIIDLNLQELTSYLTAHKISVEITPPLRKHLLKEGFSSEYGARPIRRTIEKLIIKPLAIQILQEKIPHNSNVIVDILDSKIFFTSTKKKGATVVKVNKDEILGE